MRRLTHLIPWVVLLLLIGPWPAGAQAPDDTPARAAAAAGAAASSFAPDGVPQFLWATANVPGPGGRTTGRSRRAGTSRDSRARSGFPPRTSQPLKSSRSRRCEAAR